jgi:hypothetical protein
MKKRVKRAKKVSKSKSMVRASSRKIKLVLRRFLFFVFLFIISLIGYRAGGTAFENFFELLAIIFGFVSLSLLMVLFILGIMKLLKK